MVRPAYKNSMRAPSSVCVLHQHRKPKRRPRCSLVATASLSCRRRRRCGSGADSWARPTSRLVLATATTASRPCAPLSSRRTQIRPHAHMTSRHAVASWATSGDPLASQMAPEPVETEDSRAPGLLLAHRKEEQQAADAMSGATSSASRSYPQLRAPELQSRRPVLRSTSMQRCVALICCVALVPHWQVARASNKKLTRFRKSWSRPSWRASMKMRSHLISCPVCVCWLTWASSVPGLTTGAARTQHRRARAKKQGVQGRALVQEPHRRRLQEVRAARGTAAARSDGHGPDPPRRRRAGARRRHLRTPATPYPRLAGGLCG